MTSEVQHLGLLDRDRAALDIAAQSLRDARGPENVLTVAADLSLPEGIHQVVSATVDRWEHIDIVINNLGGPPPGALLSFDDSEWQQGFDLSFSSAVRLNRIVLPEMIKQGHGGRIIINASGAGKIAPGKATPLGLYAMSKHAVIGLTKQLGVELAADGILVNCICGGIVDTPMWDLIDREVTQRSNTPTGSFKAEAVASIPIGRIQRPEDMANLAVYLASDDASYIAGQTLNCSGGMLPY